MIYDEEYYAEQQRSREASMQARLDLEREWARTAVRDDEIDALEIIQERDNQ